MTLKWQDFPEVTPPENVPLWVTLACGNGVFSACELSYSPEGFFDEFYERYELSEVIAFIVLPGPKR